METTLGDPQTLGLFVGDWFTEAVQVTPKSPIRGASNPFRKYKRINNKAQQTLLVALAAVATKCDPVPDVLAPYHPNRHLKCKKGDQVYMDAVKDYSAGDAQLVSRLSNNAADTVPIFPLRTLLLSYMARHEDLTPPHRRRKARPRASSDTAAPTDVAAMTMDDLLNEDLSLPAAVQRPTKAERKQKKREEKRAQKQKKKKEAVARQRAEKRQLDAEKDGDGNGDDDDNGVEAPPRKKARLEPRLEPRTPSTEVLDAGMDVDEPEGEEEEEEVPENESFDDMFERVLSRFAFTSISDVIGTDDTAGYAALCEATRHVRENGFLTRLDDPAPTLSMLPCHEDRAAVWNAAVTTCRVDTSFSPAVLIQAGSLACHGNRVPSTLSEAHAAQTKAMEPDYENTVLEQLALPSVNTELVASFMAWHDSMNVINAIYGNPDLPYRIETPPQQPVSAT